MADMVPKCTALLPDPQWYNIHVVFTKLMHSVLHRNKEIMPPILRLGSFKYML